MPTLSAAIKLTEDMSGPLKSIMNAMNSVTDAMDKMQSKSGKGLDSSSIAAMKRELNNAGAAMQQFDESMQRAKTSEEKVNKVHQNQTDLLNGMRGKVLGVVGAYAGFQGIKNLVNLSDEMSQTQARLDLINDGTQTTDELMQKVYQSAQRSRGAYSDTADLVARLGANAKDAFSSNDELISFAEQVNKQFVMSGASAQEMSAASLQLSQALASGTLRGDEFNSIAEQAPSILTTVSQYLGVSRGEVRGLAADGKITADVVKNAILGATDQTNASFNKMPMTFSQVWTSFKNTALMNAQPVLDKLSEMANSSEFQAGVKSLGESIAGLIPTIVPMVSAITGIITAVSRFPALVPGILILVGAFSAAQAVISAFNIISTISNGIMAISAARAAYSTATSLAEAAAKTTEIAAQWGFNAAILACPITWIIVGIVALIAVIILLATHWDFVRGKAIECWNGIVAAFSPAVTALQNGWNNFQQTFGPGWDGFRSACATTMANTQTVASAGFGIISSAVNGDTQGMVDNAKRIWDMLPPGVQGSLVDVYGSVTGTFDQVTGFLSNLPGNFFNWGQEMIQSLVDGIKGKVDQVEGAVEGVANKIREFLHFSVPDKGPLTSIGSWMPDMIRLLANDIDKNSGLLDPAVGRLSSKLSVNPNNNTAALNTTANAASQLTGNVSAQGTGPMASFQTPKTDDIAKAYDDIAQTAQPGMVIIGQDVNKQQDVNSLQFTTDTQLMVNQTKGIYNSLPGPINSTMQVIEQNNKDAFNRMLIYMGTMPPAFQLEGVALMNGLNDGIVSQIPNVLATTGSLVEQLKATFITGLGIHSPARFTEYVGNMSIAGLIKGLSPQQLMVFIRSIVDQMKSSFAGGAMDLNGLVDYLYNDTPKLIEWLNTYDDGGIIDTAAKAAGVNTGAISTSNNGLEGALSIFEGLLDDDSHGYSQSNRWGSDFDCSSSIIWSLQQAGLATNGASYTGNMSDALSSTGWERLGVPAGAPAGLERGDIVLNDAEHVAWWLGNSLGAFHSDYDGAPGDSSGTEANRTGWYDHPWNAILRYTGYRGVYTGPAMAGTQTKLADAIQQVYNQRVLGLYGMWSGNGDLASWLTEALNLTGQPLSLLQGLMYAAMKESGGNPNLENDWDNNAAKGTPSIGLLQTIQPTFDAYKLPGHDNIRNPVDNAIAAIRYMIAKYGSVADVIIPRMGGWYGYSVGSRYIPEDMLAMVHAGEAIIPASEMAAIQKLSNPSNPYANSGGEVLPMTALAPILSASGEGGSGFGLSGMTANRGSRTQTVNYGDTRIEITVHHDGGTSDKDVEAMYVKIGEMMAEESKRKANGNYRNLG